MLQDVIHPPEQLPIEGLLSPISAQMFDFSDPGIYSETLQRNTEISSCSNYCYEENSYPSDLSFSSFSSSFNNNTHNNNLSLLLDDSTPPDNENEIEISAPVNFNPHKTFSVPPYLAGQQEQFDISSLQSQIPLTDVSANGFSPYSPDSIVPLSAQALPSVFEDDCLSPLPSFSLEPSGPPCSFLDPVLGSFLPGNLNSGISPEISGMFSGSFSGSESGLQSQELEFHGEGGGLYRSESMPRVYSSSDIQALSESQQLVNGCGSPTLTSDMTTLEESTFKVGRLSVEERKEKIHRYMKKRNERNFTKKIKYACRKTLADSRPRVRGRFAKNDDFGESTRPSCSNHEDEEDEEGGVKEEEEMVDSSDIFTHISGVNSFKCNYPLQSWI